MILTNIYDAHPRRSAEGRTYVFTMPDDGFTPCVLSFCSSQAYAQCQMFTFLNLRNSRAVTGSESL